MSGEIESKGFEVPWQHSDGNINEWFMGKMPASPMHHTGGCKDGVPVLWNLCFDSEVTE